MLKVTISKSPYKTLAISSLASLFLLGMAPQLALAESATSKIIPAEAPAKIVAADMPADADFKKLDANSDKKLSLKEAVKDKALATSFDMTDANKDGNITPDEYASYKASASLNPAPTGVAPAANPVN